MRNLPLCHGTSQLFNLRASSSTDVPVLLLNQTNKNKERAIRKVVGGGGGVGNFRVAGIFFRYQIPCMNFFKAIA